jgi:HAD superfamily phosphoserine phosphatase-like hydrolase
MTTDKVIIYCDFDGTITKTDVLDKIITDIYSYDKYKEMENKLLTGEMKYENYLTDMFDGIEYNLTKIPNDLIDEHFFNFYKWVSNKKIDFYIISSGFKKIIQFLLPYVNSDFIYGNDISIDTNDIWNVIFLII